MYAIEPGMVSSISVPESSRLQTDSLPLGIQKQINRLVKRFPKLML